MLYGWVSSDNAERIDNTDDDAFKDGVYYFGGEDDGAMTTGWLLIDVSYDEATNDDYKYTLQHSMMMMIRLVGSTSSPTVRSSMLITVREPKIKLSTVRSTHSMSTVQW